MKKLLLAACALLLQGVVHAADGRDVLMQVSTIDALMNGLYDGELAIGELKRHGDFGIGTFDALDGEMVVLDGQCYQVRGDGSVHVVGDARTTPFATVTFFDEDQTAAFSNVDLAQLQQALDARLPTENLFYAIRMEGIFKKVRTRSVPAQTRPYRPLVEVTRTQPEFEFENVRGVMVGFRAPPFVKGVNVPGYHLHFLTEDRKAGGHVLEATIGEVAVTVDHTPDFYMQLPRSRAFQEVDLTKDREAELYEVEK